MATTPQTGLTGGVAAFQIGDNNRYGQLLLGNDGVGYMMGRDNVATGDFVLGHLTSAADTATTEQLRIAVADGKATFAGNIVIPNAGNIGSAGDADAIAIASDGAVTISQSLIVSGNLTVTGTTTQVNTVTMNAANAVVFEGATADDFETTLTITDPTADRTITLPDQSGTVHTSGGSIVIPNAANIGSAGDADAIAIASNGVVTFSQIPVLPANSILIANLVDNSITEAKMANDAIGSAELKTLSTLLIKNAAGSTLKTLHGAGA